MFRKLRFVFKKRSKKDLVKIKIFPIRMKTIKVNLVNETIGEEKRKVHQ